MTTNELATQWEREASEYPSSEVGNVARAAVRCCARELRSLTSWIPVGERLPEDHVRVLIADRHGKVTKGFHMAGQWYDDAIDQWPHTTHWQPLPTPPAK